MVYCEAPKHANLTYMKLSSKAYVAETWCITEKNKKKF